MVVLLHKNILLGKNQTDKENLNPVLNQSLY